MKSIISSKHLNKKNRLLKLVDDFDSSNNNILKENRNTIKLFDLDGTTINIKSFKVPNLLNKIIYNFFRKGKAQRSFEYALKLITLEIGTPEPIAYFQESNNYFFGRSYYVSKHLNYDLTYRELTKDFNYPDFENILRQFTRFTFELHEKGVNFLDHSPGNTLIVKNSNKYDFYLVDLNRMKFGAIDFNKRIKNFARLTPHKKMVEIMSDEYAKCMDLPYKKVFDLMWGETTNFQSAYQRKKGLRKN